MGKGPIVSIDWIFNFGEGFSFPRALGGNTVHAAVQKVGKEGEPFSVSGFMAGIGVFPHISWCCICIFSQEESVSPSEDDISIPEQNRWATIFCILNLKEIVYLFVSFCFFIEVSSGQS